jgi:3-methyladenine DNA glycosylase AlkD
MHALAHIELLLKEYTPQPIFTNTKFYKTSVGDYAEHDRFIGVSVPSLRKIAKNFLNLHIEELHTLLASPFNEKRLLALLILINQYNRGNIEQKKSIYQFYVNNLQYVNNWNLVDASAHLIIGSHLINLDKGILLSLARSENMWKRRISIVSTLYFIRNNDYYWTIRIAEMLVHDSHDLIHKAVGWMLREVGKRNINMLIEFLDQHGKYMPRTMLRYAIEKFSPQQRQEYLSTGIMDRKN